MKSTSQARAARRAAKRNRPISDKAYNGFRERIISIHHYLGYDPGDMLRMLDEYLAGNKNTGGWACLADKMAFMVMRDEIDRAMARSARARENARLRRERRERQVQELLQEQHAGRDGQVEPVGSVEPVIPVVPVRDEPSPAPGLFTSSARDRRCVSDNFG